MTTTMAVTGITETRRRVKVYSFNEKMQWEDMGTGHVSVNYVERLQSLIITVRSEDDAASLLLESKVLRHRVYQKQEETLIVWTENDNTDLALSFQEKTGCNDLWAQICDIQGTNPSASVTQEAEDGDTSDTHLDESCIIELPLCELGKLEEIFDLVTTAIPSPMHRESLVQAMERENYIPKLLELFHICEDLENPMGLHHLYNIFRTLFLINKAALLNVMFQEEHIVSVVGCLEYNPSKPQPVRHREYLAQVSRHREVIPFNNPQLLNKIHQTYQVMYIQEVILPTPSLFEENMMSALNSFVMFNKADIINTIQDDGRFLRELFTLLQDEATPEDKYRELIHLLREICLFSQALEVGDRTQCFKILSDYGFMSAVEGMLVYEDKDVVGTAVDILMSIADFHCSILRDHILQDAESQSEDNQFMNLLINLLVDGEYTDLEVQMVGLIKIIIDPEAIMAESTAQTVEKSLFLNYFYKHCMHRLMAPLMAQTAGIKISRDTPQNSALLSHILDILSLCVGRHTYLIRNYIIDKNALSRVLVLMTSSHAHLTLAALRFCRRIVGLKDEFYNRYIVRDNLLAPIIKAFIANGRRYNLLNSAIIELFEYLRVENVKSLVSYVVEHFWSTLEHIEYVDTFKALRLKHEQEMDRRDNKDSAPAV
jgi:protein phosphatase-4 regulatory subunit 3